MKLFACIALQLAFISTLAQQIDLIYPEDSAKLKSHEWVELKWSAPNDIAPGVAYQPTIRLAVVQEGQTKEEALSPDSIFYERTLAFESDLADQSWPITSEITISPLVTYAWQIVSVTDNQEIKTSPIYTFKVVRLFQILNQPFQQVAMIEMYNTDLEHLNGLGKVRISETDSLEIEFSNISVAQIGSLNLLQDGYIEFELPQQDTLLLPGRQSVMPDVVMTYKKIRLTREERLVSAVFHWNFDQEFADPAIQYHSDSSSVMCSVPWSETLHFSGNINFQAGTTIELNALPEFQMVLDSTSTMLIYRDTVAFNVSLSGSLIGQNSTLTPFNQHPVTIDFQDQTSFDFITGHLTSDLILSQAPSVTVTSEDMTVDLRNDQGIDGFDNEWTGIHFNTFSVAFEDSWPAPLKVGAGTIDFTSHPSTVDKAFIDNNGLTLTFVSELANDGSLGPYPCETQLFAAEIVNDVMKNFYMFGSVEIPAYKAGPLNFKFLLNKTEMQVDTVDGIPFHEPYIKPATDTAHNAFQVNWYEAAGAVSYKLDVSTDNFETFVPGLHEKTIMDTFALVTNLRAGVTHHIRVKAVYGSQQASYYSLPMVITTDSLVIETPQQLVAKPVDGSVMVQWNDMADNEAGFVIERGENDVFTVLDTLEANTEEFIDVDGCASGSCKYRVKAINGLESSAYIEANIMVITGLPEITSAYVSAYPNPTAGLVYLNKVTNDVKNVSVVNHLGMQVGNFDPHTLSDKRVLDLTELPDGFYLVYFSDNHKQYALKVQKVNR